ncbi:ORF6N domain-containing protein [Xanthobacter sediminis]
MNDQDDQDARSPPVAVDSGQPLGPLTDGIVLLIRGMPVMLDSVIAAGFGVETREVNQAVARNPHKFGLEHRFQLSEQEKEFLTSQGVIPKPGRGGSRALPHVYTQKGVARLATILDTPTALAATDRMIDLYTDVHRQLAQGRRSITVSEPGRHLPDQATITRMQGLREQVFEAISDLLKTKVPRRGTTIADEIGTAASNAWDMLQAHMKAKSLENEKVAAETLLIIEKVREIRDRTRADVEKADAEREGILLGNMEKRLALAERAIALAQKMEPDALALMGRSFVQPRLLLEVPDLSPPTGDPDAR